MRLLVTGGAGFIGTNYIKQTLAAHPDDKIVCIDSLTYAGNYENIKDLEYNDRFVFKKVDICQRQAVYDLLEQYSFDCIINFAAESHVDRSFENPNVFLQTNIVGTGMLLDATNKFKVPRFHQVSTDEVYGELPLDRPDLLFNETWDLKPSSPYSASKAAADLLVLAYFRTFRTPITISRCSNNYGPYQFPEKLIPLMYCNAISNLPLPVYGDGQNVRDWLYVEDHCTAINAIIRRGKIGEIYNIGGNNERTNIDVVRQLLKLTEKPESLISYVEDRRGHDRRYGIDPQKIQSDLAWRPLVCFEDGLKKTVTWYKEHFEWIEHIKTGKYRDIGTEWYHAQNKNNTIEYHVLAPNTMGYFGNCYGC